jgi:hypothetical protein
MNFRRYIKEILYLNIIPFYNQLIKEYKDALWQQNKAFYHTSRMITVYLKAL